jgi:2'-5' RNA ligase
MRLFFAVKLSEQAREGVAAIIAKLAKAGADYKWVETENLHLTLAFLGETPEEKAAALQRILKETVFGHVGFSIAFDRIGAFDSLSRPRILWLAADSKKLCDLAQDLRLRLQESGLLPEAEMRRPFKAHLTLGRQRSTKKLVGLRAQIAGLKNVRIENSVRRLLLVRSRLSSEGPMYEELAGAQLPL